jgi:RNA polymerase sigma-70 factor, ECF subfamily
VGLDWAQLYEELFPAVVRYLHRQVWNIDRAHELAQEVFVRALHAHPEQPRAWVFTVAANLARDEARHVVRRKKHLALLKHEVASDPPPVDPLTQLAARDRAAAVRRALATLSARDREVLLLWDAGLKYTEIAAQTGLAVNAIGTTLSRARRRLVEAYASQEELHAARG